MTVWIYSPLRRSSNNSNFSTKPFFWHIQVPPKVIIYWLLVLYYYSFITNTTPLLLLYWYWDGWKLKYVKLWFKTRINKDYLFSKIEFEYIRCHRDLVINGCFQILSRDNCHTWFPWAIRNVTNFYSRLANCIHFQRVRPVTFIYIFFKEITFLSIITFYIHTQIVS